MYLLTNTVEAAGNDIAVNTIVSKITTNIISPVIQFVFVLALLYFVWGMFKFFKETDDGSREEGRQHILWGTIGMAVMISVYGIIRFVAETVGQSGSLGF